MIRAPMHASMADAAHSSWLDTTQGFEFDYVGLIFGRDLRWDPATNTWIRDPSHSHDAIVKRSGARFTDLVKRTYRVLLTRGLKGCYVYFEKPETRGYVATSTSSSSDLSLQ